jgi:hypothetical protein
MVEPLEETRSELAFATEPLSSTLQQAIPTSSSRNNDDSNELDEIEVCRTSIFQIYSPLLDSKRRPPTFSWPFLFTYIRSTCTYKHNAIYSPHKSLGRLEAQWIRPHDSIDWVRWKTHSMGNAGKCQLVARFRTKEF